VAAVARLFQRFEVRNELCTQGIQVNVANQFKKIGIFLAKDRRVAVLKKFSVPAMSPVEIGCMTRQQPSHYSGHGGITGFQKKMNVIGDQCPGLARCAGFRQNRSEPIQEIFPVLVVAEYLPSFDSPKNKVMQRTPRIYPGFAWQDTSIPQKK